MNKKNYLKKKKEGFFFFFFSFMNYVTTYPEFFDILNKKKLIYTFKMHLSLFFFIRRIVMLN